MRISVIGLGKLGAPMAALFAAREHEVTGLDHSRAVLAALEAGLAPHEEPRLQEMIDAGRARLRVTSDHEELVVASDVTFVVVPTPSDDTGAFANRYVVAAIESLGAALRRKDGYHVISVTSTVMPGAMDRVIAPALERACGRSVGRNLGLCYNPEFIALGSVIENMLEPDFLLIGESDPRAGELVASVYDPICTHRPPIKRMSFVNAELAKIAVNTFVTTKISYANMLADVCDRLPGADVDVVSEAIGADSRIGRKYLRGAVGYGGPCFPRDNVAFAALASRVGARADIARATDAINRYQIERLVSAVQAHSHPGSRVAVLGMAYKPDTAVIEESQGVMLARALLALGHCVVIHDPIAARQAAEQLGPAVTQAPSAAAALDDADIAVIVTPWPEYAKLGELLRSHPLPTLDCWRVLSRHAEPPPCVIWLGTGRRIPERVLP